MCDDWAEDYEVWDDEYGYDEVDDELEKEHEEEASGPCPECGVEIDADAEMCAACGYWLTTADRHVLWDGGSGGVGGTAKVVIVVILIALLLGSCL